MAKKLPEDNILSDPFKDLAMNLDSEYNQSEFEEDVVDFETFVNGEDFMNYKWDGKNGCRPKILEIGIALVEDHVREAMLLLGKGSGKDFISSLIHLYGIYKLLCMKNPQSYLGLSSRSVIYFVNTARNDTQAKKVFFAEFKGHLANCKWFDGRYGEPGINSVRFQKNIEALSVNSQAFGWLGFNTIQWVGDELAFFLTNDNDEDSESRAEECWEAAYGSCKTRFPDHYKMIGITTPRYDDDFVMHKFNELKSRDDGYVVQMATWDIHPNLTKEDFKYKLITDERRTMRDFGAVAAGIIESFWPEPDFVEDNVCEECYQCPVYQNRTEINNNDYSCIDYAHCKANGYAGNGDFREWLVPDPTKEYVMHFDLSATKDYTAFTLGHLIDTIEVELDQYEIADRELEEDDLMQEKALVKVDAVGFINPKSKRDPALTKNGAIWYDGIFRNIILGLINKGFHITTISFDQYQSLWLRQKLEDMGIDAPLLSCDKTDEVPAGAKIAITENRVEYPYDRRLCNEAKYLKYLKGSKVDHVSKKSKDIWDSFASVIFQIDGDDLAGCALELFSSSSEEDY